MSVVIIIITRIAFSFSIVYSRSLCRFVSKVAHFNALHPAQFQFRYRAMVELKASPWHRGRRRRKGGGGGGGRKAKEKKRGVGGGVSTVLLAPLSTDR